MSEIERIIRSESLIKPQWVIVHLSVVRVDLQALLKGQNISRVPDSATEATNMVHY